MFLPHLILASSSPRRRELLAEMDLTFDVLSPNVSEFDARSNPGLLPAELAMENARRKAKAIANLKLKCWILGADTVVALEGQIFGKPADLAQAREYLCALSGRTHEVITGCAVIDSSGHETVFHDVARVTFRKLTNQNIDAYLAAVHVLDKAGAYALQERGESIVAHVGGSRSNVIGLPTEKLGHILAQLGFSQAAGDGALKFSS